MMTLNGLPASAGIASGLAMVYRREMPTIPESRPSDLAGEVARLSQAIEAARAELQAMAREAETRAGSDEAAIFAAQAALLEDPAMLAAARQGIAQGKNAAAAWWAAIQWPAEKLRAVGTEPWLSRAGDLKDVGQRVLGHLLEAHPEALAHDLRRSIVIASDLTASELFTIVQRGASGLGLANGSVMSHAVILARALGLPVVVGLGELACQVPVGTPAILDGDQGRLILWPDEETRAAYRRPPAKAAVLSRGRAPAVTRDGHRITIMANIGHVAEVRRAIERGAEGVGLLRTEFLYLGRQTLPDEEEQVATYAAIAEALAGRPLVIRTLDASADKAIPALALPRERNPALGLRGIRVSLRQPAILTTQLRAILRVAARFYGEDKPTISVVFPMISTMEEWHHTKALLDEAAVQLAAEHHPVWPIPVGLMIEVPAAALLAEAFAQEADLLSLGTNDLMQYLLAGDRDNPEVASLLNGLQPALLRLIHGVIQAAQRAGKSVSLCGELAASPEALPVLIGLGLDTLSMDPAAVPAAIAQICRLSWAGARRLAGACLSCASLEEVQTLVRTSRTEIEAKGEPC